MIEIFWPAIIPFGIIPISIILAWVNWKGIKREWVGTLWHVSQFLGLFLVGGWVILSLFDYDFPLNLVILLLTAVMHWIVFDTSLNYFRGLDALYVGYTSFIDRSWRWLMNEFNASEAAIRTGFMVFKIYLFFGLLMLAAYFSDFTY